jgi:hypothetical protein
MSSRTRASSPGGGSIALYMHDLYSESGAWFTASAILGGTGIVYYNPIQVPFKMTINGVGVFNGLANTGNRYVAFYDSAALAPVHRLAASLLTATTGTRRRQLTLFTASIQVDPGLYFLAFEGDTNPDELYQNSNIDSSARMDPLNINNGLPFYEESIGFGVPPAIATPALEDTRLYVMWANVVSVP